MSLKYLNGVSLADITRKNVHDLFGMVLQDTWLFEIQCVAQELNWLSAMMLRLEDEARVVMEARLV